MELLALHAVRLRGMPDAAAVAARFDLDPDALGEELLAADGAPYAVPPRHPPSGST